MSNNSVSGEALQIILGEAVATGNPADGRWTVSGLGSDALMLTNSIIAIPFCPGMSNRDYRRRVIANARRPGRKAVP